MLRLTPNVIVDKTGKEYASTTPNRFCVTETSTLTSTSVHPPDQSVDLILPVASISTFHKVCRLLVHATTG